MKELKHRFRLKFSIKKGRVKKTARGKARLSRRPARRLPAGFSITGALVASTIGAISVLGLTQMSTNMVNTLTKAKKELRLITLSEEIKHSFQLDAPASICSSTKSGCGSAGVVGCVSGETRPPQCDGHISYSSYSTWGPESPGNGGTEVGIYCYKDGQVEDNDATDKTVGYVCGDALNACSNSLLGHTANSPGYITIKDPSGTVLYHGGKTYKDIKIRSIRYTPDPSYTNRAVVSVHFSLSESSKDVLAAPESLHFTVFLDQISSAGKIERCTVTGANIAGAGLPGIADGCRKVLKSGQTLLGCGGTEENKHATATAFGSAAGSKKSTGAGNSFFGFSAGLANTSGAENTFIGFNAGHTNTKGNYNSFFGHNAGYAGTGFEGSNNILIGESSQLSGKNDSNRLRIGNRTNPLIQGSFKNFAATPKSYPEIELKGSLEIRPPVKPEIVWKAIVEPGLSVKGEMHLKKQGTGSQPLIKIKADGTNKDPFMILEADLEVQGSIEAKATNPGMKVIGDMRITKSSHEVNFKTDGSTDPLLTLDGDLKVKGSTDKTAKEPGLKVLGKTRFTKRGGSNIVSAEVTTTNALKITADLTVGDSATTGKHQNGLIVNNMATLQNGSNTVSVTGSGGGLTVAGTVGDRANPPSEQSRFGGTLKAPTVTAKNFRITNLNAGTITGKFTQVLGSHTPPLFTETTA